MFSIKSIIHRYPEPGHSFLPCDRCFGHIEKARRKVETVFLPEEYEKLVSETSNKYNVIHVEQDMILNFYEYLMPLCKKIISNKEKAKFTIMAYRYIEYISNDGLYCGTSGNSTIREHYNLEKNGEKLIITDEIMKLYNGPIKLKLAKYNDVIQLASKYVPNECQWFYMNLTAEEATSNNRDCDSDYEM